MSDLKAALQEYICSANSAINIKLVRSEEDVYDDSIAFHPEYTHQLFGDNEVIFGYRSLRVELYYCATLMTPYFSITHEGKVDPQVYQGVKADEVFSVIAQKLPEGDFLTSKEQLITALGKAELFKPPGQMIHEYHHTDDLDYRVFKATIDTPGFLRFLRRIQTFLLWFVDGASFVDDHDERWLFYTLFQVEKTPRGDPVHRFVGYITVYNYFAYPDKVRPRISQVLILPPYQSKGHGASFLSSVNNDLCARADVLDIAVEDPSDDFTKLRDYVDCRNCSTLASFQKPHIHEPFTSDMAEEARQRFRLNKMQARRVYEILRLQATNMSHADQGRQYRLMIKERLNRPFQKQKRDFEKMRKHLSPEEAGCMLGDLDVGDQHKILQQQYDEVLEAYGRIVERLERA